MSTAQITGSDGLIQYAPDDDPDKWQCAHCGRLIDDKYEVQFKDITSGDWIVSCMDCYDDYYAFYQCPEDNADVVIL